MTDWVRGDGREEKDHGSVARPSHLISSRETLLLGTTKHYRAWLILSRHRLERYSATTDLRCKNYCGNILDCKLAMSQP